jgi:hypothetical protein
MPMPFRFLAIALLLSACSRGPVPAETPAPASPPSEQARPTAVSFVDKVWRVRESSAVEPGTLYVFLSEGTLVIASPHGKPALGTWKSENGALTMVEESIPYKIDILKLTRDELRIRSHNPGEPVEITMVPADAPLSQLQ